MINLRHVIVAAVLILASSQAQAGVIYTNRALFDAATPVLNFEGFNTITSSSSTLNFSGFTVVRTGNGSSFSSTASSIYVSEGARAVEFRSGNNTNITFTFANPTNSFAIDINSWGTIGTGSLFASTSNSSLTNHVIATRPPNLPADNTIFFGYVDTQTFTSLTIRSTTNGDVTGLDNMSFGFTTAAVPEPASMAIWLVGGCCGCFGFSRRKRST